MRTIPHSQEHPADVSDLGLGAVVQLDATAANADDPTHQRPTATKLGRDRWRLADTHGTSTLSTEMMLAAATYEGLDVLDEGLWVDEACVIKDLDEDIYHGDPVRGGSLSQSSAKVLLQPGGPARFQHQLTHPREDRPEFSFGRAAHALVLGIGAPIHRLRHADLRTRAAKAERAEAEAAGKTVLRPADHDAVLAMADALSSHPGAMEALENGDHEVSAFAKDEATGVWTRGRFDVLGDGWIGDYKTAASADPREFARAMARYGYHIQAAHYIDLACNLGLFDEPPTFRFVVQEKAAPFLPHVIEIGPDSINAGRREMSRALALYASCAETGQWPGYDTTTVVDLPAWAMPAELDADLVADLIALTQGDAA